MIFFLMRSIMHKYLWVAALALLITGNSSSLYAATPWGENYFPNVPLITHEGKTVHFFDDLIKDKVVVINFIYTHCPDSCPLETAQLARVQKIMGDRLGKDVFFYSITVDPENDTPAALKEYRERFKARWTFLTGKNDDIILLRKKLGLYIEEIQDGSNNHNVSLIIGNQATGRWMKRSPFENPHVLADQIGNWLTGWKTATVSNDYTNAPKLRNISRGEQMFRTRCATCHTVTGNELAGALGPDLLNINKRRDRQWLFNWLKAPDQMLQKKDPIAIALYKKYNNLVMPNMRLNKEEAQSLLNYIGDETLRLLSISEQTASKVSSSESLTTNDNETSGAVIEVLNSWIRVAHPTA
ncbi:MAG: SCO family protein, partial [Methylococcales bacterium]|nr:SCO family protein [Methylococcales bacterium]